MFPRPAKVYGSLISILLVCALSFVLLSSMGAAHVSAQSGYSLSVSPGTVHDNQTVTVSWTAPSGTYYYDWIGLYKVGDPDSSYMSYWFLYGATSGTHTVTMPAPVDSQQYEFRYFLNNGYTRTATSGTVTVVNHPPTPGNDTYTVHGSTTIGPFRSNDSDPDGDSLTIGADSTSPTHGTLYGLQQPDMMVYTPNQGYTGTDSFTYQVCDPFHACSTATVTLNVVNHAPVAVDDLYVVRGSTTIGPFMANDYDTDNDPIVGPDDDNDGPYHGSLYGQTQPDKKTYTPNAGYVGFDSFTSDS